MNDRGEFLQSADTGSNFKSQIQPMLLPACGNGAGNNLLSGADNLSATEPTVLAPFIGGSFKIGWYFSDNTTVTLSDFQLETKEVTQAQFQLQSMLMQPSKYHTAPVACG